MLNESVVQPIFLSTTSTSTQQRCLFRDQKNVIVEAASGSSPVLVIKTTGLKQVELLQDSTPFIYENLHRRVATIKASFHRASVAQLAKFERLCSQWITETAFSSSVIQMANHQAYQQIIGMGEPALPFILKKLQEQKHYWFWALKAISGEDPVPSEKRGSIPDMTECWINWGKSKGYVG